MTKDNNQKDSSELPKTCGTCTNFAQYGGVDDGDEGHCNLHTNIGWFPNEYCSKHEPYETTADKQGES